MAEIYEVKFYNDELEVTVTKNAFVVNDWILQTVHTHRRRLHKLLVGLDIEWLPCFKPEENHPVALLQLCVGRRCLLFQLLHKDAVPGFLVNFLGDPNFKFVGVGVKGDADKLLRDHKLFVSNTVDLNRLALSIYGEEVYGKMGLKRMAREVLGKVMEKPLNVTLSKWDAEELVYEQVEYAAIDAFASFEIGKNLFNLVWERERENHPRVVKRKYLNCHHQPPLLLLQDTQGMFRTLALF
ncbi:3'-5' exonuclease-like [Solanum dulcamara]|uniref:3'-5' exonuclease-like n=1 Tax=Solanum dulcamara TaxID=45834 RepID=UPI002485EF78|nr:3'-5' exonuclease-like [Solanum dulcamara]